MNSRTKQGYIEEGRKFFEKHCATSKERQLCFPNIDVIGPSQEPFYQKTEEEQFKIEIYKALKGIEGIQLPMIVLNQFLYNHEQLHLWDPKYEPEMCAKSNTVPNCSIEHKSTIVGCHDFVIIGPDYVVIIDVYTPTTDMLLQETALEISEEKRRSSLNFKLSSKRASLELIRKIASTVMVDQSECENVSDLLMDLKLFHYIAFLGNDDDYRTSKVDEIKAKGEKIGVLRKENVTNLKTWWIDTVLQSKSEKDYEIVRGNFECVKYALLAIWREVNETGDPLAQLEDNATKFQSDGKTIEKIVELIPEKITLHRILQLLEGPLLGKLAVDRLKSAIAKTSTSCSIKSEQFSIIKDIVLEKSLMFTLLKKLEKARSLKTEQELKNKTEYLEHGKKLYEIFGWSGDNFALMFPACPYQQYVDLHRNTADDSDEQAKSEQQAKCEQQAKNEQAKSKQAKIDKQKQEDCEAEIKMYRALENLKGQKVTVIHGLKYTHFQYRMWLKKHDGKNCSKCNRKRLNCDEGENDFVVIGPNYIVLIEVKNAEEKATLESMMEFTKSAVEQQSHLMHVIEGIAGGSGSFKVFRFVAFPNYNDICDIAHHVQEQLGIQFILGSDLPKFTNWWHQNITNGREKLTEDLYGDVEQVKFALLAIWATKYKKKKYSYDGSEIGFKGDVVETDRRLRFSEITITSNKKTRRSPCYNVERTEQRTEDPESFASVNVAYIFSRILGIKYITENQKEAFENKSENLVITGCVGSGKSLILIARLLRQALTSSEKKMLLLVFNQMKLIEYERIFKRAQICCMEISENQFDSNMWQSRIGIVHCNTKAVNTKMASFLENIKYHDDVAIYVDDAHAYGLDLSSFSCACVTIDFNQCHITSDQSGLLDDCSQWDTFDLVALSHNYRSTWNIVENLTNLSKFLRVKDVVQKHFAKYPSYLSHEPSHGHLIYGPQTDIDVVHFKFEVDRNKQLKEVLLISIQRHTRIFPKFRKQKFKTQIFIIDPSEELFDKHFVHSINSFHRRKPLLVSVNAQEQNIYSTEFAACMIFVVFLNLDTRILRSLFNAISRARAYCHIVVTSNKKTDDDELQQLLDIFKEAKINHIWPSFETKSDS